MEGLGDDRLRGSGEPSDSRLIESSWDEGERFGALFDRHYDVIRVYCERRLGRTAGQDVAADVFLTAFAARHTYDLERPTALPWLYGIATNLIRRHRRDEASRFKAVARQTAIMIVSVPDEEGRLAAAAEASSVIHAIEKMRPKDRDILLLFAWADLSYDDIAKALDIAPGTVRSRLARARRRLKQAEAYSPERGGEI